MNTVRPARTLGNQALHKLHLSQNQRALLLNGIQKQIGVKEKLASLHLQLSLHFSCSPSEFILSILSLVLILSFSLLLFVLWPFLGTADSWQLSFRGWFEIKKNNGMQFYTKGDFRELSTQPGCYLLRNAALKDRG